MLAERGGQEIAAHVQEQPPVLNTQQATAPMWEAARIQAGAVLVLARTCELSVPEFIRRYV